MHRIALRHGQAITASQIEQIAAGAALDFEEGHWRDVERSRALLDRMIGERRRIYGVTTGYGPLAGTWVDSEASARLQRGLVYHLSAGTGPLLDSREVRAIMAARAATVARGHSAIRPETLRHLLRCLEAGFTPEVPALGTVGASGDLTPLAHITLGLMGEGNAVLGSVPMPAARALADIGATPLDPRGKDALALVNGTSAMTGLAALGVPRARRAVQLSAVLTVLYGEVLGHHREAFHPGLAQVRPHAGQQWAQQCLAAIMQDSASLQEYSATPPVLPADLEAGATRADQPMLQDPYTFRCAPQHLGAVVDTLRFHENVVAQELSAVTDNPVFLPDSGEVVHGGNFFGQHVALSADAANNALLTLAIHCERRLARVTDPQQNGGLPPFVRGNCDGLHSGFMGAQVTATALVAELRTHASPASIQSIPTNANNQDVVTLGTIAARRVNDTLDRLEELLAIEALVLVQAAELRGQASGKGTSPLSSCSRQLREEVRVQVPPLGDDRPLSGEIRKLAGALRGGGITDRLMECAGVGWEAP